MTLPLGLDRPPAHRASFLKLPFSYRFMHSLLLTTIHLLLLLKKTIFLRIFALSSVLLETLLLYETTDYSFIVGYLPIVARLCTGRL
jgi:hypothetical protein